MNNTIFGEGYGDDFFRMRKKKGQPRLPFSVRLIHSLNSSEFSHGYDFNAVGIDDQLGLFALLRDLDNALAGLSIDNLVDQQKPLGGFLANDVYCDDNAVGIDIAGYDFGRDFSWGAP